MSIAKDEYKPNYASIDLDKDQLATDNGNRANIANEDSASKVCFHSSILAPDVLLILLEHHITIAG